MFETTETIDLPRDGKLHLRVWAVGPTEDDFVELLDSFVDKARAAVQNDAPRLAEALTGRKLPAGISIESEEMSVSIGATAIHCQLTAVLDRGARQGTLENMLEALVVNDLTALASRALAEHCSAADMRPWSSEEFDDPDAIDAPARTVVERSIH